MAKESTFTNMVLTLSVITVIAAASLASVYNATKEPIAMVSVKKKNDALKEVLPAFDSKPIESKVFVEGDSLLVYKAYLKDEFVGIAVESITHNAFSGDMKVMVGFKTDGTIYKVKVLEHKETPGLGDKVDKSKSNFSVQFEGKNPKDFKLSVKKDGGDVDAITASTISSRAFCDAIIKAWQATQN